MGSYATSYIKTTTTAVTRVADNASKSGISSLINSEEGSFYNEVVLDSVAYTTDRHLILKGDASNYVNLYFNNAASLVARIQVAGVSIFLTSPYTQTHNKVAIIWKFNKYALFLNGVKVAENLTGQTFSAGTLNLLDYDNVNSNVPFYGNVQSTMVFPTALSDADLIALTTL